MKQEYKSFVELANGDAANGELKKKQTKTKTTIAFRCIETGISEIYSA